jgi:hypothetical protein
MTLRARLKRLGRRLVEENTVRAELDLPLSRAEATRLCADVLSAVLGADIVAPPATTRLRFRRPARDDEPDGLERALWAKIVEDGGTTAVTFDASAPHPAVVHLVPRALPEAVAVALARDVERIVTRLPDARAERPRRVARGSRVHARAELPLRGDETERALVAAAAESSFEGAAMSAETVVGAHRRTGFRRGYGIGFTVHPRDGSSHLYALAAATPWTAPGDKERMRSELEAVLSALRERA